MSSIDRKGTLKMSSSSSMKTHMDRKDRAHNHLSKFQAATKTKTKSRVEISE